MNVLVTALLGLVIIFVLAGGVNALVGVLSLFCLLFYLVLMLMSLVKTRL